jgi:hypothetical protein
MYTFKLYASHLSFIVHDSECTPCGGVLEYLHRNPASLRRLRKGNPVPGVQLDQLPLVDINTETSTSGLEV